MIRHAYITVVVLSASIDMRQHARVCLASGCTKWWRWPTHSPLPAAQHRKLEDVCIFFWNLLQNFFFSGFPALICATSAPDNVADSFSYTSAYTSFSDSWQWGTGCSNGCFHTNMHKQISRWDCHPCKWIVRQPGAGACNQPAGGGRTTGMGRCAMDSWHVWSTARMGCRPNVAQDQGHHQPPWEDLPPAYGPKRIQLQ